jgi:hypothetical protein
VLTTTVKNQGPDGYRPLPIPIIGRFIEADTDTWLACRRFTDVLFKALVWGVVLVVGFGIFRIVTGPSDARQARYEEERNCTITYHYDSADCVPNR